ncbi:hypothetical protein LIER_06840 [Lithospermum erythrorhizon]|uniref:Uncharacterized protein n=1 Tax=Lithospermum erythrorhizon TaxID=34254 RepID=A0AAV3P7T7_LITER
MGPHKSDIKFWCGRYDVKWVSFTEKDPGRRFVRYADRVRGCRFCEWIDELVSPLVKSIMSEKLEKDERKVWILEILMVICVSIVMFSLFSLESPTWNCNYGQIGFSTLSD